MCNKEKVDLARIPARKNLRFSAGRLRTGKSVTHLTEFCRPERIRTPYNFFGIYGASRFFMDLPGIEPGTVQCECTGMPFTYKPAMFCPLIVQ